MKCRQLKAQAKELLRGNWGHCILYAVLPFIVSLAATALLAAICFPFANDTLTALLPLLTQVLLLFFAFGYMDVFVKIHAGTPVSTATLFRPFTAYPGKVVGYCLLAFSIGLIGSLVMMVLVVLFAGFGVVLSIPLTLIYAFLTQRFVVVPIILLDRPDISVWAAFVQGYTMMRGYTWRYILLELSFIGWGLLAIPTFGIILLWIFPYKTMTTVNFYYAVKARQWAKEYL